MNLNLLRYMISIVLLAVLLSCASRSPQEEIPVLERTGVGRDAVKADSTIVPPRRDGVPGNAAVQELINQATNYLAASDYAGASESLERALRISPENDQLYFLLAETRTFQGKLVQAEQLCNRAISLAPPAAEMRRRCQLLIDN